MTLEQIEQKLEVLTVDIKFTATEGSILTTLEETNEAILAVSLLAGIQGKLNILKDLKCVQDNIKIK